MMSSRHQTTPIAIVFAAALAVPALASAQTDYYNTDKGRPLHVEDAYPIERRAFEIQAAPLRLERGAAGVYHWTVEPEIAYGIMPRTQVEFGLPLSFIDAGGTRQSGVSGLDLSVLYNLNVETSIPALGLGASALLPVGALAPDDPYFSFKGIATRTFTWARFHLNGEYTLGDAPSATRTAPVEATRWSAGVAADRAFPLRSLLMGAELLVQQPLIESEEQLLIAGTGIRYQLSPRWAIDGGIGKRLTGDDRAWYATFGSAYTVGLPWHP